MNASHSLPLYDLPPSLQAKLVSSWIAHRGRVRAVAVSPNERLLLTAGRLPAAAAAAAASAAASPGRPGAQHAVTCWDLEGLTASSHYTGRPGGGGGLP